MSEREALEYIQAAFDDLSLWAPRQKGYAAARDRFVHEVRHALTELDRDPA